MLKFTLQIIFSFCCLQSSLSQNVGFAWAKQISSLYGTAGIGADIKLDPGGNIYCAGRFRNTFDFDPSPGVYTLTSVGNAPFVAKYDNSGNLIWARHFSNPFTINAQSGCNSICIDNSGNVYAVGAFADLLDFDPGPGTFTMNPNLGQTFVCKLNSSGNFIWAIQLGRDSSNGGVSIHLDNLGEPVIVGNFQKSNNDFDPGPSAYNLSSIGVSDIFACKISGSGNFIWAKQLGGPAANCGVSSSVIDNSGNIITTGNFSLTVDFDPGPSSYTMNSQNGCLYVSVLNSNGAFVSAWQLAGAVGSNGNGVFYDNLGNLFVCGQFNGIGDFDPGPGVLTFTSTGPYDGVICKYSSVGSLIWAKQLGGSFAESAICVKVNLAGEVFVGGTFQGTIDLDPGPGTYFFTSPPSPPYVDGYITKLDVNGNFVWAKQFTGAGGGETVNALALDPVGNIFATGIVANNSDLDPGPGTHLITSLDRDPYLLKLSPCSAPLSPTISPSTLTSCGPSSLTMSASPTSSISWRTQLMSNTYISTLSVLNTTLLPVGTYSFYAATSNTCAESFPPALVQATVFPVPTISITSSKDTICSGESVTLTATGGINYVMGSTFSSGTFVVLPTPGTTYTISGGDASTGCFNTATKYLQVNLCTTREEKVFSNQDVEVWPNPSKGEFHIRASNIINVEISNNASQLIYSESGKNSSETAFSADLPPGIYYLKVERADASCVLRKLVVLD